MNKKILSFRSVGISFRRKKSLRSKKECILQNITFDLNQGDTLGVIGRNGAGKSTLLKLLANIINPDQGEIWRQKDTRSQLLTLNLGFNKNLSGRDNAIMALVTQDKPIKVAKQLIAEISEYARLAHIMEQPVGTYSAGQRARLGFSIAIHSLPEVLLLDEVLGVGDKEFKTKSSSEIIRRANSDQTVVLVSHSLETIRKLCNRVIWIDSGSIKMEGETDRVIEEYDRQT